MQELQLLNEKTTLGMEEVKEVKKESHDLKILNEKVDINFNEK